ncbi:hypothetical protein [Sporosarcina sp. FSL W7-1283]|uniref:hypothetical protein n=1 Tax=Sporosarcina sp. FSL W7-1283 TaxID=2921560 RepID=UPI0030F77ABD
MRNIKHEQIPEGIDDYIFKYRYSNHLKAHGYRYSGNKQQLVERIENMFNDDIFYNSFLEFVKLEISNGKNRQIFFSRFEISGLAILKDVTTVKNNLRANELPSDNFNDLLRDDLEDGSLIYLNILSNSEEPSKTEKIELCFYKEVEPTEDYTGDKDKFTDYIWVEINTNEQYVIVKVKPHTQQYVSNYHTSKKTYEYILERLKTIFSLKRSNMIYFKEVFYKMFKEFTEAAEEPFRQIVNQKREEIFRFQDTFLPSVGISSDSDINDITNRYMRLIERNLIINDIHNYLRYHIDRAGVIDRISLTDLSGASANVLSGDSDGLDVANIYFDIRETIDEIKKLDKVWIKWFSGQIISSSALQVQQQLELFEVEELEESEEEPEQSTLLEDEESNTIITRLEVNKDYVVINFLKKYWISKEVQDYVLSIIKEFEEKTS